MRKERKKSLRCFLRVCIVFANTFLASTLFASIALVGGSLEARAALNVQVTHGYFKPTLIAVPNFRLEGRNVGDIAQKMRDVISDDLENSGFFRTVSFSRFQARYLNLNEPPRFLTWTRTGAQTLPVVQLSRKGSDLSVALRLWDLETHKQLSGVVFSGPEGHWRYMAHLISNAIYKSVTGVRGYFNTKIVYVSQERGKHKVVSRLTVADQDGANPLYLTNGNESVLSPHFSPNGDLVVYVGRTEYEVPHVYLLDIKRRERFLLGRRDEVAYAPSFAPDGRKVIMSLARDGYTHIYIMDLKTHVRSQLTRGNFGDTSPSFSPDGRSIVFESDRDEGEQIYIMDADGGNVRRLSPKKAGSFTSPVWSPSGDNIAFVRMYHNKFALGIVHPSGRAMRILTESYYNDWPTWSPNGKALMYVRRNTRYGSPHIWSVSVTGYAEHQVPLRGSTLYPSWSPYLPRPEGRD